MPSPQELAQKFNDSFITATRHTGEEYCYLEESTKEGWMVGIVWEIHGNDGPNDTTYAMIEKCISKLCDSDDWENDQFEIADSLVDIYNSALLKWVGSNFSRSCYCDTVLEEGGIDEFYALLSMAQCKEYEEILSTLINKLTELSDE